MQARYNNSQCLQISLCTRKRRQISTKIKQQTSFHTMYRKQIHLRKKSRERNSYNISRRKLQKVFLLILFFLLTICLHDSAAHFYFWKQILLTQQKVPNHEDCIPTYLAVSLCACLAEFIVKVNIRKEEKKAGL